MKHRTIYCLLMLAGLALSPLAYSSPDPRTRDNTDATMDAQSQSGKPNKPSPSPSPPPPSGGSITKIGSGTLSLNYVVRRDDGDTKVEVLFERGAVKKVSATDGAGTRTLKPVKPGGRLAQTCDAEGQTHESLTLEDGQVVKIGICKTRLMGLLLPAVQKIREAAARSKSDSGNNTRVSGGASCTADKPCCFEDEKLGMNVCWHP